MLRFAEEMETRRMRPDGADRHLELTIPWSIRPSSARGLRMFDIKETISNRKTREKLPLRGVSRGAEFDIVEPVIRENRFSK